MPNSYKHSTARWPIADFVFKGLLRDDQLPLFLADGSALLERKAPFIMIHDLIDADPSPRKHRYVISDWIRDHDKELREHCLGTVIVLESLAVRLVLQFIFMISPMPNETFICRTRDEAERWSAACFKRNGLDARGHALQQSA